MNTNNFIEFKVPDESLRYILLQRTAYLKSNPFFRLLGIFKIFGDFGYRNICVGLRSKLFSSQIKKEFIKDMNEEYFAIKEHLPDEAGAILDIGCGVAGIDVLLSKHYADNTDIYLIDKTEVESKVYYGYKKRASFYNSLQVSRRLLEINGVDKNRIHLQEAAENDEITFDREFDVVVSLFSWGYHFPVKAYLDQVYDKIRRGGILVLDVRKGTGGEGEIEEKFGNSKPLFEDKKYTRLLAVKTAQK